MKLFALSLLFFASACAATTIEPTYHSVEAPTDQHQWLLHLVGEWDASSSSVGVQDDEFANWKSTETVRPIGGHWILAEGSVPVGEEPFESVLTLGYDTEQSVFVGSWIDSMQTRMWTYRGSLDEAQRILTLEAEGPSFSNPDKLTQYRDAIELVNVNHKRMISSTLGEDGKWIEYMTVDYHRAE